jgi:hypothetical protein
MAIFCKQCMASLLLLAVFLQTFSKAVTYVDFCVNRESIARTLCENRDNPILHCGGRCVLHKRLAKQGNEDKNAPEKKETAGHLFWAAWPALSFVFFHDVSSRVSPSSDKRTVDRPGTCFQPPD